MRLRGRGLSLPLSLRRVSHHPPRFLPDSFLLSNLFRFLNLNKGEKVDEKDDKKAYEKVWGNDGGKREADKERRVKGE